jgi:hypothetical protein
MTTNYDSRDVASKHLLDDDTYIGTKRQRLGGYSGIFEAERDAYIEPHSFADSIAIDTFPHRC